MAVGDSSFSAGLGTISGDDFRRVQEQILKAVDPGQGMVGSKLNDFPFQKWRHPISMEGFVSWKIQLHLRSQWIDSYWFCWEMYRKPTSYLMVPTHHDTHNPYLITSHIAVSVFEKRRLQLLPRGSHHCRLRATTRTPKAIGWMFSPMHQQTGW